MTRLVLVPILGLAACLPAIPQHASTARASLPEKLPTYAPCALVHGEATESLSNGAHGWFRGPWKLAYTTFVLRRPEGVVLVDASVGDGVDADVDGGPALFRWTLGASAKGARPLGALLAEIGVKPEDVTDVLLTHAHWDHTGGLTGLPKARVHMASPDADFILSSKEYMPDGGMPHHFAGLADRVDRLDFSGPAYEGFAASADVFKDGSIVAVPTYGHTRGATTWFVNSGDGHRWAFVGDAAWVKEGFEEPVTKGRLASLLADWDREQTADVLGRLHALWEAKSAQIVTSHDERTWVDVPRCVKP